MALSINVTARKIFSRLEEITNAKLNQLGLPTVTLTGTASTSQIADGAVTAVKGAYGPWFYCSDATGSANAVVLTKGASATALPTSLVAGQVYRFYCEYTNTGAVTVAVNGIAGTKALTKQGGLALAAGDLRVDQVVEILYDGSAFQLLSPTGQPEAERYVETASADGLAYTATFSPTLTALTSGARVLVKWNTTNTGAVTLAPNGLTAKAVRKANDQACAAGDLLDNQISELVYDSTANGAAGAWLLTTAVTINTPATVTGLTRNLVIKNNATNPTFVVDITADEAVLKNAGGLSYLAETVSVSANITGTVGTANSLDTGSEAANTWYYLWLIYNGSTVASLLSTSSTAPTLPSGYSYKALVGAVLNDGSSNFITFRQAGKDVWINETNIFTATGPAAINTYEPKTLVPASGTTEKIVPPIAVEAFGSAGSSGNIPSQIAVAGDDSGLGAVTIMAYAGGGVFNSFYGAGYWRVPLKTAQTIQWQALTTAANYRLNVSGYRLP